MTGKLPNFEFLHCELLRACEEGRGSGTVQKHAITVVVGYLRDTVSVYTAVTEERNVPVGKSELYQEPP
jgi:hypothetical protein